MPGWRNGNRSRLKICRSKGLVGSTPTPGTKILFFSFFFPHSLHQFLLYHRRVFVAVADRERDARHWLDVHLLVQKMLQAASFPVELFQNSFGALGWNDA